MDASPPPSEIHYVVQEVAQTPSFEYKLTPSVEEIVKNNPTFVLGRAKLFAYTEATHSIHSTPEFQRLLKFLIHIHEVDPKVMQASSLEELNTLLQKHQGFEGGLLRKEGTERWELKDSVLRKKFRPLLDELFQEIGLTVPFSTPLPLTVDHCMLFGAHVSRMEKRIRETLTYLEKGLTVTRGIYLLGSTRPLTQGELEIIQAKASAMNDTDRVYWKKFFDESSHQTEGQAFLFLWKVLVPGEVQQKYRDSLTLIQSSRLVKSAGQDISRPCTESTVLDWNAYYQEGKSQSVFALVEIPFVRLLDQFQTTVLTNGKRASRAILLDRMKNCTLYTAFTEPPTDPLVSVTLDEIARNVYRVVDTLSYLESVK